MLTLQSLLAVIVVAALLTLLHPRGSRAFAISRAAFAVVFALVILFFSSADAHDKWADGSNVPAWVRASCCGPADAHMDPQLTRTDTGYVVDGLKNEVEFHRVLPSQDGHVWAFYNPAAGVDAMIYCLFIPLGM